MPVEIERGEVDGIPLFWSPVDGPLIGALMFGVGRAHEPPSRSGISHLVEHLALAPLGQQDYGHNGFVAGPRTVFTATGTAEELVDFLSTVAQTLADLPLDRLGMERRILRQESQNHQTGVPAWMLWYRYGNRGHGLLGTEEIGLSWLGPDLVREWAATWFNRGNAALWLSGPPPPGLRIPLADGDRPPRPPLDVVSGVELPAHVRWQSSVVATAYVAPRSARATTTLNIAGRRARDLLRFELGAVYDVSPSYEALDADTAQCALGTDCQPHQTERVRDELVRTLGDIARDGPTPAELQREVRAFRDMASTPHGRLGLLDSAAFRHLLGRSWETPAEIDAEFGSLTAEDCAAAMREHLGSLMVGSQADGPGEWPHRRYPTWSPSVVEGKVFRPAGLPIPGRGRGDRLIVGADGVSWVSPEGHPLTVRYDGAVAYRHWEGDLREIIGEDGFRVRIVPTEWRNGREAVRLADAAVPPAVVACDEHGIGGYEDPGDRAAVSSDAQG